MEAEIRCVLSVGLALNVSPRPESLSSTLRIINNEITLELTYHVDVTGQTVTTMNDAACRYMMYAVIYMDEYNKDVKIMRCHQSGSV